MKLIQEKISEFATLYGFIHEPLEEMPNITEFPVMLVLPGARSVFAAKGRGSLWQWHSMQRGIVPLCWIIRP